MKLLYITNAINGAGGLERVLSIKASYLAEHYNYFISILSLNEGHLNRFYDFSDKINFVSIPVSGNPLRYMNQYQKGIKETVYSLDPDIISVCDDGLKGFFIPQLLNKNIPIIYERHASIQLNFNKEKNSIFSTLKSKIQYNLMKWAASKFDRFVVLTQGNLKEWNKGNLQVIPNPLSFYPDEIADYTSKRVIAVGSHSFNKGYDLLLQAWKIITQTHPDWKLAIFGKKDVQQTFLKMAQDLEISHQVDFFDPVADIQTEYLNSSIMVLPSRSEGFGMVLIEAMACGLSCVSFDCPHGPADIIQDEVDGFLVENENYLQLAENLKVLMNNQYLRSEMGKNAKENVKRYLPESIMQEWDNLFKSLVQ